MKDSAFLQIEFANYEEFEALLQDRFLHFKEILNYAVATYKLFFDQIFKNMEQALASLTQETLDVTAIQFINLITSFCYCKMKSEFYHVNFFGSPSPLSEEQFLAGQVKQLFHFHRLLKEQQKAMRPLIAKWFEMSFLYFLEILSENVKQNAHVNQEKTEIRSKNGNYIHDLLHSDLFCGYLSFFVFLIDSFLETFQSQEETIILYGLRCLKRFIETHKKMLTSLVDQNNRLKEMSD